MVLPHAKQVRPIEHFGWRVLVERWWATSSAGEWGPTLLAGVWGQCGLVLASRWRVGWDWAWGLGGARAGMRAGLVERGAANVVWRLGVRVGWCAGGVTQG
ncbi:hypothetical protein GCM10010484_02280 [Actinokineospora globicatena]